MILIRVTMASGNSFNTRINCDIEEARRYYAGASYENWDGSRDPYTSVDQLEFADEEKRIPGAES